MKKQKQSNWQPVGCQMPCNSFKLLAKGLSQWLNGDVALILALLGKYYLAVDESIESIVLANAYIEAWVVLGATLTNEDVASLHDFATKLLNTESFAM